MQGGLGYICAHVRAQLNDFVDRELPAAEILRVQEHIRACAPCAEIHAFEASVIRQIKRKVGRSTLPPALVSRVLLRITLAG
jgi:anti-sigma factor (TIGR02949 family)